MIFGTRLKYGRSGKLRETGLINHYTAGGDDFLKISLQSLKGQGDRFEGMDDDICHATPFDGLHRVPTPFSDVGANIENLVTYAILEPAEICENGRLKVGFTVECKIVGALTAGAKVHFSARPPCKASEILHQGHQSIPPFGIHFCEADAGNSCEN